MMKEILLTGIKPTGEPHLGNFLGTIQPTLKLMKQKEYTSYVFIADYHALTTCHGKDLFNKFYYSIAATWLALGLDPEKVFFYRQSDIKEIFELAWILSCHTSKGMMNRAHAYKSFLQSNREQNTRSLEHKINIGVYTYPILMAADILLFNADIVPVGQDQVQHVEISKKIAQAMNGVYGEVFHLPKALIKEDAGVILGIDGRKMSKNYGNTIPIFSDESYLRKKINKIKSDSRGVDVEKDPDDSLIFDLYKCFGTSEEVVQMKEAYRNGISWGSAKEKLFQVINKEFEEPRKKYHLLLDNCDEIDRIIEKGGEKVSKIASENFKKVKRMIGHR